MGCLGALSFFCIRDLTTTVAQRLGLQQKYRTWEIQVAESMKTLSGRFKEQCKEKKVAADKNWTSPLTKALGWDWTKIFICRTLTREPCKKKKEKDQKNTTLPVLLTYSEELVQTAAASKLPKQTLFCISQKKKTKTPTRLKKLR